MSTTLIIRQAEVENANAISGLTWGFPSITHFLGFTHRLSRALYEERQLTLNGCGIVVHSHQVQACQPAGYEWRFALTRNPLTKEGNTAPFNEEGRVNFSVSMVIECEFTLDQLVRSGESTGEAKQWLESKVALLAERYRLAGGMVTSIRGVEWHDLPVMSQCREARKLRYSLLPGFTLLSRHTLLHEHHQQQCELKPQQLLDSLLDFVTLKYAPSSPESTTGTVEWARLEKPAEGYLAPVAVGYQAISPLYPAGAVARSRDRETPFRFAESLYTLGEWKSPHRLDNLDALIWRYHPLPDSYLCLNGELYSGTQVNAAMTYDYDDY